ncbi:MAG: DNA internalization-related competence protein ComEC/Rec2 [Magnetococcales bacterium]|nr:DNA internalization-related competence protein ComEC/Rec2 [Magnetococcales bacterium]
MIRTAANNLLPNLTPTALSLFLAGTVVGILFLLAQDPSARTVLISSALFVGFWAVWLRWKQSTPVAMALLPLGIGLLGGLGASFWHLESIRSSQIEQKHLEQLALTIDALKQKRLPLTGVVADREDRFGSTRIWLDQGQVSSHHWQTDGLLQITIYKKPVLALPGDRVSISAKLFPLRSPNAPGLFDYGQFLRNRGIVGTGYATEAVLPLSHTNGYRWNRLRQKISDWVGNTVDKENQGLVEALLVGKRGRIEYSTNEALSLSGTLHLIAISGLHLGLVAGWSFFLIRFLLALIPAFSIAHDNKRPASLLSLPPLITYASLAGWSLSTQRAAIMIGLYLLAYFFARHRAGWRALILAAIILLLWHPFELFQAGFQLSFLAVAILLIGAPYLEKSSTWRKKVLDLIAITLLMQIAMAPIVFFHFHRLVPYGFLGNFLAVPWVSLISAPLGLLALISQGLHPVLADWFLHAMAWSLSVLQHWIEWISDLPGAWQRVSGPSAVGLGLCFFGMVWAGMLTRITVKIVVFCLALSALFLPKPVPSTEGTFHLAILDVGQAQSAVFRSPTGNWSVLDAGGTVTDRFNVGESIISAYLWHYGVDRLQRIVISHPQSDHMAGAGRLMQNFKVEELWLGDFPLQEQENKSYRHLLEQAHLSQVLVRRFKQAETIQDGPLQIQVFPPPVGQLFTNLNDRSLVLNIKNGRQQFLFPGDLQAAGEDWLSNQATLTPVTLTLAPHHGSNTSSTPIFIGKTRPHQVVFSVGWLNQHRFPRTEVLERWKQSGARLWRTDQDGTLIFQSDGTSLKRIIAGNEPLLLE